MTLLSVRNASAGYGATRALFDVSLEIAPGETLALLGRNGTGKTTTIRTVCRLLPLAGGELRFDGHDLAALPAHRAARLGIGLVPEGRRCFRTLDVRENLVAAARPGPWDLAAVEALFPRLAERRAQRASALSGGEQQMLAIGRALMTNPRLLILDEATEGLAPLVRAEIWSAIRGLGAGSGLAILVVDKSLAELARVADRTVVLERGVSVWSGPMASLPAEVIERRLGL